MRGLIVLCGLMGCSGTTVYLADRCDLNFGSPVPSEGAPGSTIVLEGGPATRSWDTIVTLNGTVAENVSVERENCGDCETCRNSEGCNSCDDCDACDLLCTQTCEEVLSFVVPPLEPGTVDLIITNSHGSSAKIPFEVLVGSSPADTGADSGAP